MASRVSAIAQALGAATQRVAPRARFGTTEASRSLAIRRDPKDVRALWSDPASRAEVLRGLPAKGASLTFGPEQGDWGTTVTLSVDLEAPLPRLAAGALAGKASRRLKALAETGEVPTTQDNPSARTSAEEAAR